MHPADEQLIAYADATAPEVEEHVATCSTCTKEVERFRLLIGDLQSDTVWADGEAVEMPSALADLAQRVDSPASAIAAVKQLNSEVLATLERDPRLAEALSREAIDAAIQIADDEPVSVRAHLLGTAWKNRASALRLLGEYAAAFAALEQAELAFAMSSASRYDIATVDYVRATTLYFADRHAEALVVLDRAAEAFIEFADHRRYGHARLLEGCIHFDTGDAGRARDVFYALLPAAHADSDRATLARLFGNIAQCYVNLGDHPLASTYARQALSLYKQLGMRTEAIRTEWILGRLHLAAGEVESALDRLRTAEQKFLQLGMKVEASLVGLDVAEALIACGDNEAVAELCKAIISRFVEADLPERTRHALALAVESVRGSGDVVTIVGATRRLVDELPATVSPCSLN